jgi:Tol biopolymer transport system component/DNA-binding winged helix-turn-helix (wHTH) protein
VRFATFEVDLRAGEVRKGGVRLKLGGQPFQVLAILLERPGQVVTREELQKRLWPDTFVDVDHNLNTAINKIREALNDVAESPRFVETLPRRGYRFIGVVEKAVGTKGPEECNAEREAPARKIRRTTVVLLVLAALGIVGIAASLAWRHPSTPSARTLTRITFEDGLQTGATWSPDGRYIAYASNRGGKFDIWVQQISGGDPIQVTKQPGQNWQPDWSPDGQSIAYRNEEGAGGLFVIPALGGAGQERKIASFGFHPRWSPDSSRILFQTHFTRLDVTDRFYVVDLGSGALHQVLTDFLSSRPAGKEVIAGSAAWHPDGKRISVWGWSLDPSPIFWTVAVDGGGATRTEIAPAVRKQFEELAGRGFPGWLDMRFAWAPAGDAIYFERTLQGARSVWKLNIDSQSLRGTSIERLTTGTGADAEPSLSPDGKKLAFTSGTKSLRAWMFPFNATSGRILGPGQAVSSPATEVDMLTLSPDGTRLAFWGQRSGKGELWEKELPNGPETLATGDKLYGRSLGHWSPDSRQLAYGRMNFATKEFQIVRWSSSDHNEEPITTALVSDFGGVVWDWSPDGKSLLCTLTENAQRNTEIWQVPLAEQPRAETAAHKVLSSPDTNVYQSHFSPDGQWIVFETARQLPDGVESVIYVTRASGGPWIPISKEKVWDDKPRWSPDGKIIYFVSNRGGFFNVWGVHFDSARGAPVGEPFRVTSFDQPSLIVPSDISNAELSLSETRLVITVEQKTGSIWVLDNVNQ